MSAALGWPGSGTEVEVISDELGEVEMVCEGEWQNQAGVGDRAVVVEGDVETVRVVGW